MLAKLETLPWLALSRICEYLDDDDDDYDTRSDLRAFSLTSRQCCAATASRRYCEVRVAVTSADDLVRGLEQWAEMLDRDGGRYRYVQRLKVILPDHNKAKRGEPWLAIARFIGRLPALKNLVWGFWNMPQPVLTAIHALGTCRLHMHRFRLDSLVVHRNGYPQVIDIDPGDYALATSPALCSVVAEVRSYECEGELNYNGEAVLGMVAGAPPNLQHVWLLPSLAGDGLALRASVALGKPPAPPGNLFSPQVQVGNLRSLFFTAGGPRDISAWAARADFSKLRYLVLPCDPALAAMAARGELASLRGLCLQGIDMEGNSAVSQLLTALNSNSLRGLSLSGHIHEALFDTVLDRHGKSLRHLSLQPYPKYDEYEYEDFPPTPPVFLTPALSARLAEKCPNLEEAQLSVDRSLGDARECAVYRGLGRLPRLRHLSLTLWYIVSPNEDVVDENGEFNHDDYGTIPRAYLSQAFVNAAVDAGLARAIFDMLSPSGGLQHLQLLTSRKSGRYTTYFGYLETLLSWFSRDWICERRRSGDDTPVVEIRGLSPRDTEAGKEWQSLAEASKHYQGEEVFVEAFGDVWPQTTPRWWEDWRSSPLCPDDGRTE